MIFFNTLLASVKLVLKVTEVGGRRGVDMQVIAQNPKRIVQETAKCAAKSGIGVMLTQLNRLFPLAGLAVALSATLAWMGFLGYYVSKLF
jgi:hypothetical protein